MALNPTRISELNQTDPQPTDQIPMARGSGTSGRTYKTLVSDLFNKLFKVTNSPTIDLNFDPLSLTLEANLTTAAQSVSSLNTQNSPTVNLNWNPSTRTLSADVSTAVKNASAFNVVNSPTINLDWNASTRTLSAVVQQDSIRYSHLASWQTLSGSPTLSAEAVQPRLAKAWLLGRSGMNSAGATTDYAYNCSLVYVRPGVVRILFHQPFMTQTSYVFSWGTADSGTVHHFVAEAGGADSGLSYSRKLDEIVLGYYAENAALETTVNGRINVVFFGI